MKHLLHDSKIRGRIALAAVSIWIGVPAICVLGVVFGFLVTEDLKELLPIWHQFCTWLVMAIVGYYFGSNNISHGHEGDTT